MCKENLFSNFLFENKKKECHEIIQSSLLVSFSNMMFTFRQTKSTRTDNYHHDDTCNFKTTSNNISRLAKFIVIQ